MWFVFVVCGSWFVVSCSSIFCVIGSEEVSIPVVSILFFTWVGVGGASYFLLTAVYLIHITTITTNKD